MATPSRFTLPLRFLLVWGLFVVYGTTLPFDLTPSLSNLAEGWNQAHRIPWRAPDGGWPSLPDVVTNVLLFLPWGFLLAWEGRRHRWSWARTTVVGAATALLMSALVEFLQLFSSVRTTSATDLVTNLTGGGLGAAVGWFLVRPLRDRLEPSYFHALAHRPYALLALAAALGVVLLALSPFDLTLDVSDLKQSIKSMRPIPFGPPLRGEATPQPITKQIPVLLAWSLMGGLLGLALREAGRRGAGLVVGATVGALFLSGLTEALQLILVARVTDATTVLVAGVGAFAGALAAAGGRATAGVALLVWTLAMLGAGLSPWRFAGPGPAEFTLGRWVPFLYYFARTDVYALADAVESMLRYAPAGALLAVRWGGSRWSAAALAAGVALAVEVAQVFLPDRTTDVTDVFLAAVGAALGWWAWTRATAWRASHSTTDAAGSAPGVES